MDKGSNISFPLDSGSTVYNGSGISVGGKASTDILHAAGGTTKVKTLNGESILGEGNIIIDPSSVPVLIVEEEIIALAVIPTWNRINSGLI